MPRTAISDAVKRVETVVRDVISVNATAVDREARWPEEGIRALLAAELGGLVVPESSGGLGHGLLALAQVCEAIGRACASTAICFGMHCVGAAVIAAKATRAQKAGLLEPIAAGRHLTTLALSEPGTGANFYIPETELTDAPDGYRVNGQKAFVTNGGHADSYVVSTRPAGPRAGPGDFSCVVVPGAAQGMSFGPPWNGAGMRGNSARTMTLKDVPLHRDLLLGQQGDEIWYVFNVVAPYFIVAMSGTYLGVAASAFEEAKNHLRARQYTHSGASPSESAIVQHRLGMLWATVERTRLLIFGAAARGDAADPAALVALCSAKAEVSDCAVFAANEALSLVGGRGYSEGSSPLLRHLRDARAAPVMAPTTDMLRTWAGRALLDLPLLAE